MSWAQQALGLVETKGLVGAIEAADAGLKAANVSFLGNERADAGLVCVMFGGDVAAVRAAVDAGSSAAERIGELVGAHVIPRPHKSLDVIEGDENESPKSRPPMTGGRYDLAQLESAKVVELRTMARSIEEFPIKGRDIARAGRDELLAAFRSLNG